VVVVVNQLKSPLPVLLSKLLHWHLRIFQIFQMIYAQHRLHRTLTPLAPVSQVVEQHDLRLPRMQKMTVMLTTYEDFIARSESLGFMALSHLLPGLPSLGDETIECLWHTGLDTDP
jgi:hypothetical protein